VVAILIPIYKCLLYEALSLEKHYHVKSYAMQKDTHSQTILSTDNRYFWLKTIIAFSVMLAIATFLGAWQLQRLAWKEKLIADLNNRSKIITNQLPFNLNQNSHEFMNLSISGKFIHEKESYLYTVNQAHGGQGYMVITPFQLADGRKILVNRGFVPLKNIDPNTRLQGQIAGIVAIKGLLRFSEKPNAFIAEDNLAKHIFYNRSSEKIWAAINEVGENVFVDQTEPRLTTLPIAGEAVYNLPNNHLQYALTWFGLALTLCVIFGIFVFRERKRGKK
jgi:surfeit locus 1 family protein